MQTKSARMREIVKQDNARRADRLVAELALFADKSHDAPDGIDPYHWDRSITGVPSEGNRNPKASPNSWLVGLSHRCVGVATGTETTHKGPPTVRVITADSNMIRPVSDFSKKRDTRAVVRVKREDLSETAEKALEALDRKTDEVARIHLQHDYTA